MAAAVAGTTAEAVAGAATGATAGTAPSRSFDLDARWDLHPQVSVRPEPFGALLYHFGTRKLSFLKDRRLLDAVTALERSATAREACRTAGIAEHELPTYRAALATLVASSMVVTRG